MSFKEVKNGDKPTRYYYEGRRVSRSEYENLELAFTSFNCFLTTIEGDKTT